MRMFIVACMVTHVCVYACMLHKHLFNSKVRISLSLVLIVDICWVDMRSNNKVGEATLIHKKGSKVVGLHCNPVKPDLLLTCGNDHFVSFNV